MQLTIEHWRAWMPGIHSPEQWQQWCKSGSITNSDTAIDVSAIPPLLRRRLSPMGRAATCSLMPLLPRLNEASNTPIVFGSRHGEVGRTQKMLCGLAQSELLSPTAFSLSVHNAICGIISINQKITANISAIAATGSELLAVMIEAAGILNDDLNKSKQVLCVLCDEPLPAVYGPYCDQPQQPFAFAFIMSKASDIQDQTTITLSPTNEPANKPISPLQLINLLCGEKTQIKSPLGRTLWSIERTC